MAEVENLQKSIRANDDVLGPQVAIPGHLDGVARRVRDRKAPAAYLGPKCPVPPHQLHGHEGGAVDLADPEDRGYLDVGYGRPAPTLQKSVKTGRNLSFRSVPVYLKLYSHQ